jgi:predicted nucleotidyltransferase
MKKDKIQQYQHKVLKSLAGKIDDFKLAGGTALSLFYFQHRKSFDLDFFTANFKPLRVQEIVGYLKKDLRKEIKLVAQSLGKDRLKLAIYNIIFTVGDILKIDFVEDVLELIKRPKMVEGINILSLEDIYLRKIYAIAGTIDTFDEVGHKKFIGGRSEAKDFYDLYFLSHTFMALADFTDRYCNATIKEGLIRWFRSFDRLHLIEGLLSLDTNKRLDYKELERHFKKEIDKIIVKQVQGL